MQGSAATLGILARIHYEGTPANPDEGSLSSYVHSQSFKLETIFQLSS